MRSLIRYLIPAALLCLAVSLGGCVVYPEGGYWHGYRGPGWGWHEGWRR